MYKVLNLAKSTILSHIKEKVNILNLCGFHPNFHPNLNTLRQTSGEEHKQRPESY